MHDKTQHKNKPHGEAPQGHARPGRGRHKYGVTRQTFRLYNANNPKYFPLLFLRVVFENISPYFNLWMSAEIVTALYEKRAAQDIYLLVAVTLFGNFFVHAAGAALNRAVGIQLEIMENNEAAAFNHKTLSLDYDKMENPEIRQLRRRIRENSYINYYGIKKMRIAIGGLMSASINIVFSLALFAEMAPLIASAPFRWTAVLLFAALIACLTLQLHVMLRGITKSMKEWEKVGEVMLEENRLGQGYQTDGMDNRIYCQEKRIFKLSEKVNRRHLEVFSKVNYAGFAYRIPETAFGGLTQCSIYLIICLYCALGIFPVGSVIKYVGYLAKITDSIARLVTQLRELKENEPYLQTYLDYFAIKNDMYQGSLAVEKRSDKRFEVEFRNVSFRYAGQEEYALKNISLTLQVGERLAVVGMNGSGKTTFIKLLCRLYDPTEGEIYMNDFNIRKYDYREYLGLFSVVFQDYTLLSLPLGNNVASAAGWDTVKAERLLREVGFGERYGQMPKGLETPLYKDFDEDGVNISGGEAQKIALARALYKNAPFIILDEPTAALDPIAEAEIYSRFDEIVEDKTAIYISHRLSSCRFCDKIAVFDKGEIVQVGTHEELLADAGGKYYELWNAQAQYYAEGDKERSDKKSCGA